MESYQFNGPSRETMNFDVVIIGAGPAGLSAAIRLSQLSKAAGRGLKIAVVEKGADVGSHILSGAILDPRALYELIPDWASKGAPIDCQVRSEEFQFLGKKRSLRWPQWLLPKELQHRGCYIVRLGELCKWLASEAELSGVDIFPGFSASEVLYGSDGSVSGIATGSVGIEKDGSHNSSFQPGAELYAESIVFAEGCSGSLSREVIQKYNLASYSDPQTYGLGIKELWRVPSRCCSAGRVTHTAGWPLGNKAFGGGFIYELSEDLVSLGLIISLDYSNPYLDPFEEFQLFKTHPQIKKFLHGGERLAFGARSITEGGIQSLPQPQFPGGILVGDAAGFLNASRSKGIHTAMKSGMIAAETIFSQLESGQSSSSSEDIFSDLYAKSWLSTELHRARNFRPAMGWGLAIGTIYAGIDLLLLRGKAPWTLHNLIPDHKRLKKANLSYKPQYPEPDGVITFDRSSSAYMSGTYHNDKQPSHLKFVDESVPISHHLRLYDLPEVSICPAGVYEKVGTVDKPEFHVNASNCIHCKACEIKDPSSNIFWNPPEGGDGPNYLGM